MSNRLCNPSPKHILFSTILATSLVAAFPQTGYAETNVVTAAQSAGVVKGTVLDNNGEPVIGATVKLNGSTAGAITDLDGNFTLNTNGQGGTLSVSYVGFKAQTVSFKAGQQNVKIVLKEDSKTLEDVVVVGFGTQKKVNLTGSVGIATAKDLESRPVTNVSQALQGMVPGLQISTNTGTLDNAMSINVRGTGTVGQGSSGSPLVLIDGMEGDINTVNPEDIENISVLKDAAAASIYGSRAPFGVILITTKKGKAGKPTINYNNSFMFNSPIRVPHMMNSYNFANFFNQAAINKGDRGVFSDETMQQMLDFQAKGGTTQGGLLTDGKVWGKPAGDPFTTAYANTDWFNELYAKNVFSQEHNASVTGGSEKVQYYSSFGYLDRGGLLNFGKDGLKRYNVAAKLNAELYPWLTLGYSVRFVRSNFYRPTTFDNGAYERLGRQLWPNLPIYDENGYMHDDNADGIVQSFAQGGQHNVVSDRLYHQASLLFEPIKDWITHVEFNYSTYDNETDEAKLAYYNHDVNGVEINTNKTTYAYRDNRKENYANWNIYTEYSKSLQDVHNFKVMLGYQSEEYKQKFFSTKAYGLQDPNRPELDLTNNQDGDGTYHAPERAGYRNEWASVGFFGRLNYDYNGIYLAEANLRYDGSSRFQRGNRWQWSPSFSLGWNIARENFWKNLAHTVNTLKLRASYGQLGNMNTNDWYPTYRLMTLGSADGSWLQNGVKPNTAQVGNLVSTTLTWEKVQTWNVGLDWGLFNNRLTGSFDVYTRYTKNMVGPAPELPLVLGIGVPATNNCDLKTQGWELSVAWRDRLACGLGYGINLMLSDAKTIIDSYPSNNTHSIDTYMEGREIGEIWGFETQGIAKTQEEMDQHLQAVGGQDAQGSKWGAGDIMYKDLDGKPGITEGSRTLEDHGDLKVIGNNTPRYQFGIDLTADFKGFDFRAFFQGVMKRDIWNGTNMMFGVIENQWWSMGLAEHEDYFRATEIGLDGHKIAANLDSYYPRPVFDTDKNQKPQSRYLQDASYIRLKNLQIGYTLPKAWMSTLGVSRCRLYVSAENLWTGTSLSKLFDPETITGGQTGANDNKWTKNAGNAYPLSRTWSFGLSVTF